MTQQMMKEKKIRVLVTLANHELPPKTNTPGIGRLIHQQLQAMNHDAYDITAVCIETNSGPITELPLYKNVLLPFNKQHFKLIDLIGKRIRHILFGVSDAKKVYRNLRILFYALKNIRKFDIIIVHNYPLTAIWLQQLKTVFNPEVKIIYYYHSSNLDWFLSIYPKLRYVSGIVTIAGDQLKDIPSCNILNNHVRKSIYQPKNDQSKELKIISTSNIDSNKGILHIIEAIKKLNKNGHRIQFDLYGKSKEIAYFNQVTKAIEGIEYISYKGQVTNSDLMQILPNYDLMILFSQEVEGNSMAMIESIVEARIPVVASAVGGNPLVLNNGRFGKIIRNYRDSSELYNTLLTFVHEPTLLSAYKTTIEQEADVYFSPQQSANSLSTFLHQICETA
jgi:glycosyltransferase involved in cell wall biosynthesis